MPPDIHHLNSTYPGTLDFKVSEGQVLDTGKNLSNSLSHIHSFTSFMFSLLLHVFQYIIFCTVSIIILSTIYYSCHNNNIIHTMQHVHVQKHLVTIPYSIKILRSTFLCFKLFFVPHKKLPIYLYYIPDHTSASCQLWMVCLHSWDMLDNVLHSLGATIGAYSSLPPF